jgi:hypothetical protein
MGRVLTVSDLLSVWERGLTDRPVERAINLLEIAHPEATIDQLKELPIGQRDARLMAIREALFGSHLACLTTCPKCKEQLEITLDIAQFQFQATDSIPIEMYTITTGGCDIQFRLPNSSDMLYIADLSDSTDVRRTLFERCIQQAKSDGVLIPAMDLPEQTLSIIANRMEQIDPQADIQIALVCPACTTQWSTTFDIVSYLWSEINAWVVRILREVHKLASVYGWREVDILALSPMRRQFYLELIG